MSLEPKPPNDPKIAPGMVILEEAEEESSGTTQPKEAARLDPETLKTIQRVGDNLLRVLSTRAQQGKSRIKFWNSSRPELQKVYGVIYNDLVEIQRLLTLRQADPPASFKVMEQQIRSFLNETYEDLHSMNIHGAWEYAAALDRLLLLLGDDEYIFTRLINEDQREKKAKPGAWSEYLVPDKLTELLESYKNRPVLPEARARAVECLSFLYAERSRYLRHQRAREELKAAYLHWLTFFLVLLLLLLLQCIYFADKGVVMTGLSKTIGNLLWSLVTFNFAIDLQSLQIRNALVAAATGALGSTLSGFYKLRDEVGGLTVLRSFRSAMWAQPSVGAVVGVLLWLLLKSGIVAIGATSPGQEIGNISWTNLAIFCFLAGFSEPFFLGVVQRVAGAADKDGNATGKKDTGNKKAEGKG